MGMDLVAPIPAPASPSELADFELALEDAAAWAQPVVEGAAPFLGEVIATEADIGEVVLVDADPPVALLGVACIVLIFGVGLFVHAVGYPISKLPWPVSIVGNALMNVGNDLIHYGLDIVLWMVRPLIQLATALWHGLDKLFGLGLATAASLALAIYKHIQIIGPHQIAANDTGIAREAAAAINAIIAVAPDYEFKAAEAAFTDPVKIMQSIPRIVPSTAAGAVAALALAIQADTTVTDECQLPWCDTVQAANEIQDALRGLLAGLFGAGLFCYLVDDPSGAAAAISNNAGGFLAGLGVACVAAEDFAGGALMELTAYAVSNPSSAAQHLVSVVCG